MRSLVRVAPETSDSVRWMPIELTSNIHEAEVTLSGEVVDADLIAAVETAGYEAEVH